MIPAILSCIFVLYLYRTLDAANTDEDSANESRLPCHMIYSEITLP